MEFAKLLEGAFANALEQCKGLGHEGEATMSAHAPLRSAAHFSRYPLNPVGRSGGMHAVAMLQFIKICFTFADP